jgi:hypothetical protein
MRTKDFWTVVGHLAEHSIDELYVSIMLRTNLVLHGWVLVNERTGRLCRFTSKEAGSLYIDVAEIMSLRRGGDIDR